MENKTKSVAMKVTKEQFENDLRPFLIQMGKHDNTWGGWIEHPYVAATSRNNKIGNYRGVDPPEYCIDHYNPELFLALAAMTDKEDGNVGEYWKFIDTFYMGDNFTRGKIYKQHESTINTYSAFIDNKGDYNGFFDSSGGNKLEFIKATKEEIIAYFSKTVVETVNNKVCFKSDGTDNTGIKIINELIRLGGKNVGKYDGNSDGRYYYINDKGNVDLEYAIPQGYELVSLNKEIKMKNRILTPVNAIRIINIACSKWKPKLAEKWATNIVLNKDTEISEEFYQEMRKACTTDQNTLFDEIFGSDEQLINISDLEIGEAMKIHDSNTRWDGIIIMRIWAEVDEVRYVDINNPRSTWNNNPKFKGKKVKLTITHEEIN
jgi:hypothetical protein